MMLFIDCRLIFHKERLAEKEFFLGWVAFLECLGIRRSLFTSLPQWNDQNSIYLATRSILNECGDKEIVIRLYDQLFAESLALIQSLPAINASFLLEKTLQAKEEGFFQTSLGSYENLLKDHPKSLLHDLTLYLAWDRMCVYIGALFSDPKIFQGLDVLKECLIESFVHITDGKKSSPSFFRLVEALYAYFLREENLKTHTKEEWEIFSKGTLALLPQEEVFDLPYVDEMFSNSSKTVWTLDSKPQVEAAKALSQLVFEKMNMPLSFQSIEVKSITL